MVKNIVPALHQPMGMQTSLMHSLTDTGSSATLPQSTMGEPGQGPEGTRKAGTFLSVQSQFCKVEPKVAFHR